MPDGFYDLQPERTGKSDGRTNANHTPTHFLQLKKIPEKRNIQHADDEEQGDADDQRQQVVFVSDGGEDGMGKAPVHQGQEYIAEQQCDKDHRPGK